LTVDAENHKEIVDAINLLVNDEEQRNKLITNCRTASLELNWGNEIKKLFSCLEIMN
jgi:glycosyltransferase involved in cell wall biosynthesis